MTNFIAGNLYLLTPFTHPTEDSVVLKSGLLNKVPLGICPGLSLPTPSPGQCPFPPSSRVRKQAYSHLLTCPPKASELVGAYSRK